MGKRITFKVEGTEVTVKEFERLGSAYVKAVDPVIKRAAQRVANRMISLLNKGGRSGIEYPRPDGSVHQASAAGEPPKSDTGFLASKVSAKATKTGGGVVVGQVVVSANYALMLEEGTKNIAARPYAAPAFALEVPKINDDIARAIRGVK